tara:strand:- start:3489 stop:3968 length:480 start_codon:yes stop_codon:yes gene_type:complete
MVNPLIGLHLSFGEIGVFAFLWVLVELIEPTKSRVKRAKIAAIIGVVFIILSWFSGGSYYLNEYGPVVKPMIKGGETPWVHSVVMETKEHVFLFLPFLAILACSLISRKQKELINGDKKTRRWIITLCILVILIGLSMAGMGYLISSAARDALTMGGVV